MRTIRRAVAAVSAIAVLTLLSAACTPLPDYPTTFRLTLVPDGGEAIVLTAAGAERPAIFGDLASLGQQNASLLAIFSNGLSGADAVGFWYWRYETDGGDWVEEVRVVLGADTYAPDAVAVTDPDAVPDAFDVERYTAEDGQGSFGRIVGEIAPTTIVDPAVGSVEVRLESLDALLYASEDGPEDPSL
jgi:hypothetical protein